MRTYGQKHQQSQQGKSGDITRPRAAARSREVHPILHLQRTIGNQAVLRMLQTQAEESNVKLTAAASPCFRHDFSHIPIHPPAARAIQTKLAINKSGDQYEQEADRISEQVMRMREPQLQRACTCGGGCPKCQTEQLGQEHERLQTKRVQSSDTAQIVAPPIVHEVLASPSQLLDPATRTFMESRFGHDFSQVRVHADAKAAESARAVNALAYTVGRDVVFGAGQYQPTTSAGRQLLAHELSHTIQQGAAGRQAARSRSNSEALIQTGSTETPILARQPDPKVRDDKQLKSTLKPTGKAALYADQVASFYFPTNVYTLDEDDHRVLKALAEQYTYTAQRKGGLKGKVIGHADVEMSSDPGNEQLSLQRARQTAEAFKQHLVEIAAETGKVSPANIQFEAEGEGAGFCLGDPDCKGKVSRDALAQYRRADIIIYTEKMDSPEIPSCPPTSGTAVKTIGEYIQLIGCAEVKTGYSPRQMLAVLRQMYYGKPWSATDPNPLWDAVIPCSPDLGNPKDRLGNNLYEALRNSDTIEGTDLGHVFTGLEAMACPSSSVTIEKSKYKVGIELTVDLSNESFATWGGDLGAAAGATAACLMMTNEERAKQTTQCHQGDQPQGLMYYFVHLQAPPHDLEGDLAPFVIRAAERGSCGGSLEKRFVPQAPISEIFKNYFYNTGLSGITSKDRYRCFAEAIGAKVVNGKIDNRAELLNKYERKVLSFAWAYYINLKKEIPRSDPIVQLLDKYSRDALNLFFDWLQARMRE